MKQKRAERIMEALKEMGLTQMLIVDPMSIYYLTGVYVAVSYTHLTLPTIA